MSDKLQFVIFLPEMVRKQRKPDNQRCWPDNDGQGDQRYIFFTGKKSVRKMIYI